MVALQGFGQRRPAELSGGQRQRVALARALINKPRVLLLDEPLGALDLKLREQMQTELKSLQRRLGITFIYVTHDQGEALSMSDRVAVFNQGRIEQVDTPKGLYTRPAHRVRRPLRRRRPTWWRARWPSGLTGAERPFSVRPEHIRFASGAPDGERLGVEGKLVDVQYHGATSRYTVEVPGGLLLNGEPPQRRGRGGPARAGRAGAAGLVPSGHGGAGAGGGSMTCSERRRRARLSNLLYRRSTLRLLLLLTPPLLWFGVVYLGSLLALLAQSFYTFDDFTMAVTPELTWANYQALLDDANVDIILRTLGMAVAVTVASRGAGVPHRLLHGALRPGLAQGLLLHRRHAAHVGQLHRQGLRLDGASSPRAASSTGWSASWG